MEAPWATGVAQTRETRENHGGRPASASCSALRSLAGAPVISGPTPTTRSDPAPNTGPGRRPRAISGTLCGSGRHVPHLPVCEGVGHPGHPPSGGAATGCLWMRGPAVEDSSAHGLVFSWMAAMHDNDVGRHGRQAKDTPRRGWCSIIGRPSRWRLRPSVYVGYQGGLGVQRGNVIVGNL